MGQKRRTYTHEFKVEALQLVESSDRSMTEIAEDLGVPRGTLQRWKKEFKERGENAFPGQGRVPEDQQELHKLRQEVEILRQERDILKKAMAIFARAKS